MAIKTYKAQTSTFLSNLMEWINEWTFRGWVLHTFTHQENENDCWYVAVLEKTQEQSHEENEENA